MSDLPEEVRKQLKSFVSKTTDESIDLVANLTGQYIDEKKREQLKKEAEFEVGAKFEDVISNAYRIGLQLREEHQQGKLKAGSLKEKFYSITDTMFRQAMPEIPKNVHAIDHLFQVCEDLMRNFRFNWHYLKDTRYDEYLLGLERLMNQLKGENKIGESWEVLNEFRNSKDLFIMLQATLQKVIRYYEFLRRNFPKIEKKQVDKYLEIYEELSGFYEKFISLVAAVIGLLQTKASTKYEVVRKRRLSRNARFVERSGWEIFVSGFNRNIRNAIAHKTCKVDIIKETVDFVDRDKTMVLTFMELQKETRELSALLLILLHLFASAYCLGILNLKELFDNDPTPSSSGY